MALNGTGLLLELIDSNPYQKYKDGFNEQALAGADAKKRIPELNARLGELNADLKETETI